MHCLHCEGSISTLGSNLPPHKIYIILCSLNNAQVHHYISGTVGSYSQHHLSPLQIKAYQGKGGPMSEVLNIPFEINFLVKTPREDASTLPLETLLTK